MFDQNMLNETLLEALYGTLCTMKNKELTMQEFHDNIKCVTGTDMKQFIDTKVPYRVLTWYYSKFHTKEIKDMVFTINQGMWNYQEYEELGLSAVRGMGKCSCCGELTNVVDYRTGHEHVCSVNCLNKLRE